MFTHIFGRGKRNRKFGVSPFPLVAGLPYFINSINVLVAVIMLCKSSRKSKSSMDSSSSVHSEEYPMSTKKQPEKEELTSF